MKDRSLALIKNEKVIFESSNRGLAPLVKCIDQFKGRETGCILYDKVVGLASAKLIVYSQIVTEVYTPLISRSAQNLLSYKKIKVSADKEVPFIKRIDDASICPMELIAQRTENLDLFFDEVRNIVLGD